MFKEDNCEEIGKWSFTARSLPSFEITDDEVITVAKNDIGYNITRYTLTGEKMAAYLLPRISHPLAPLSVKVSNQTLFTFTQDGDEKLVVNLFDLKSATHQKSYVLRDEPLPLGFAIQCQVETNVIFVDLTFEERHEILVFHRGEERIIKVKQLTCASFDFHVSLFCGQFIMKKRKESDCIWVLPFSL